MTGLEPLRGIPLAAQYLHQAQYLVPHTGLVYAGSSTFRQELGHLSGALPVHLMPTRTETRRALLLLASMGELAPWIRVEGQP